MLLHGLHGKAGGKRKMIELQSALIMMEHVAKAAISVEQINSEESRAEIRTRHNTTDIYPSMYGALHIQAKLAFGTAQRALETLRKGIAEVERLERLEAAMQELGIDSERELVLLEALAGTSPAPSDDWRSDRNELREKLLSTFNEMEESQWESEKDEAERTLIAAGFAEVETDFFEGWQRGNDQATIDFHRVRKNDRHPSGYRFVFLRGGMEVASGVSGEFNKLLEAIAPPVTEPSTPCVETPSVIDGGEAE